MQKFAGSNYDHERDAPRLTTQHGRIFNVMKDAIPRTLKEIAALTGDPESSISAQLRHMKKERFGGHAIEKGYLGNGLYTYKLIVRVADGEQQQFTF
jgi:hypothetical protein